MHDLPKSVNGRVIFQRFDFHETKNLAKIYEFKVSEAICDKRFSEHYFIFETKNQL